MKMKQPKLWSPESPYLYNVEITVAENGTTVDGGMVRMGIRKAEFRGKDGFWLNGKPYHQLIGGNRHQDFAYVGNAMPNSQQWRDAKRLKDAGMTIVRCAHYPMDPAFMEACDELGLFIIVPTPGWQYWNKDPRFGELVHENTRQIIRRDRNHTCVLLWEPILNETRYPEDFALKALQITRDEFPYPDVRERWPTCRLPVLPTTTTLCTTGPRTSENRQPLRTSAYSRASSANGRRLVRA